MDNEKKNKVITQILYKKYSNIFRWLLFNDLYRLIKATNGKLKVSIGNTDVNAKFVRDIHKRIFPMLEKIDNVKCLRSVSIDDTSVGDKNGSETNLNTILENNNEKSLENNNEKDYDFLEKKESVPIESISYKVHNVFVDSYDRNKNKWENINPFQFSMGPSSIDLQNNSDENTIGRVFSNVESVSITRIVLPTLDSSGNNISELYPYILLNISELGNKTNGTNKHLNNSYGQLMSPILIGDFLHYFFDDSETGYMTEIFNPRIEISKLTFNFLDPNGVIIEFPSDDDTTENGNIFCRIGIELHVKTLHKSWSTNFINRPVG